MILWLLYCVLVLLGLFLCFLALSWLFKEVTMGICFVDGDLEGRTVVVTGGTAGIGLEAAVEFAKRGASAVVVTGRDLAKGARAVERIKRESGNKNVTLKKLDLSSQKDVRRLAAEVLEEHKKIHFLVNNAGLVSNMGQAGLSPGASVRTVTEDGFELTMASNFFGHVLLTDLLLPALKRAAREDGGEGRPARIVNVSSAANSGSDLDIEDLDLNMRRRDRKDEEGKGGFDHLMAYNNSKLAQCLYSNELNRRMDKDGVESCSLHPGMVRTDIFREAEGWVDSFIKALFWLMGKNAWQGAQTTIYCVLAGRDSGVGGEYLMDCQPAPGRFWRHRYMGDKDKEERFYKEVRSQLGLA